MPSATLPISKEVQAEIAWYVPRPDVVLLGCKPFVPPDHLSGPCHVCGGKVNDLNKNETVVYCAACDRMDDRFSYALARQRTSGLVQIHGAEQAEKEGEQLAEAIEKPKRLSEVERRRIWVGYRHLGKGYAWTDGKLTNRANFGRQWLTAIGQQPDWSLILNSKGQVIGRIQDEISEPIEADGDELAGVSGGVPELVT